MNFLVSIFLMCILNQNLVYAMTPPCNPNMKKSYSHGYLDNRSYGSFDSRSFPSCFNPQAEQTISAEIPEFIPQARLIPPIVEAVNLEREIVNEFRQNHYENHGHTNAASMIMIYRQHNRFVRGHDYNACIHLVESCLIVGVGSACSLLCVLGLGYH